MQERRSKHFWVLFLISKMQFRPALHSLDHVALQSCPTAGMWTCHQCKSTRWAGDGRGHQGTSGNIRGWQRMAGDIRGWQGMAGSSFELGTRGICRAATQAAGCCWVLGGQTCGSLFGSQLRMLDAPLGANELLPDPASLWAEFWLVWSFPRRPCRAPSTAFHHGARWWPFIHMA